MEKYRESHWGQIQLTKRGLKPVTLISKALTMNTEDPMSYIETSGYLKYVDINTKDFMGIYVNIPAVRRIENIPQELMSDELLINYLKYKFERDMDNAGKLLGYPVGSRPEGKSVTYAWRAVAPKMTTRKKHTRNIIPMVNYMWFNWNPRNKEELIEEFEKWAKYSLEIEREHGSNWLVRFSVGIIVGKTIVNKRIYISNERDIKEKIPLVIRYDQEIRKVLNERV